MATAIGILVATSIAGSAVFPVAVGYSAQQSGAWVLLPITIGLSGLLALNWWRIAVRLRARPEPVQPAEPLPAAPVPLQP